MYNPKNKQRNDVIHFFHARLLIEPQLTTKKEKNNFLLKPNITVHGEVKPPAFGNISLIQIHHFADASSYAYGACAYLRLVDDQGLVSLSFLMGKLRLAPIKAVSIPRLELTAAVLTVRLDELVKKELKIPQDSSFFWTYSSAVLFCIRNATSRYLVFVVNRTVIIDEHTDAHKWRYIPSSLYPADSASRVLDVDCLDTELWLKEPLFFVKSESEWPTFRILIDKLSEEFLSSKRQPVHTTIAVKTEETVVERLLTRCSSMSKLKRVTAWVLRLISIL